MSDIYIPVGERQIAARVQPAQHPQGSVVFVHGSGVDRHDPRNQSVANRLRDAGFDTVLLDLLAPPEALHNAFDIELQAERLDRALERLCQSGRLHEPLGCFATGIGAGVALLSAARRPGQIAAIVVRSGRPDTALFWLPKVEAPTLLIVHEADECNQRAYERLAVDKELAVVPSRSHFFQEPEALDAVAQHAVRWFSRYLKRGVSALASAPLRREASDR